MKFFSKNKKEEKKSGANDLNVVEKEENLKAPKTLPKEYGVLKGFYISEKSSALSSFGQYVFKVFGNANKNEIKKQVEKGFNVKVKSVKIINLPKKARSVGRHSGFKQGFKKAVVALKEGYSIDQAKA